MTKKSPKVIKVKKQDDMKAAIEELEQKLTKMEEDRDAKCKAAREQLIDMLEVTADKYLTVTGTAEALRVVRFVIGAETPGDLIDACELAHRMAGVAKDMAERAKELATNAMDQLCKDFYTEDFDIRDFDQRQFAMAFEMMRIDLCRNVGGSAEDMVGFVKRVQEEIDVTKAKLEELYAQQAEEPVE